MLLSLLSSLWAGDAGLARGQALLYALSLAWAVALAGTFNRRHLPAFLVGVVAITALGGLLCVWYYTERNPYHRPGFPIGNPLTLSTTLLPGVLIAVAALAGVLAGRWREHRPSAWRLAVGAAVALLPLVWCLALAQARGALLALATGLVTIGVFLVGRRLRWILASLFIVGMVGVALWWASTSQLNVAMARGSTIRFRFYAWRYAAELWNASSLTRIIGQGAGDYPRLAAALAVNDRLLDPAAFMGEIVEHAHNEFFEVLSEIGLVGGVTYVGGVVATLFAAAALLRSRRAGLEWWLMLGLVSSVVALLTDALTGPALRLPGPPAVFFTLLGVLWAVCDIPASAEQPSGVVNSTPPATTARPAARAAALAALVCFAAAPGAGWLAVRNWSGVQFEQATHIDYATGRYRDALAAISRAESGLLDPVRVIAARRLALDAQFALAREAFRPFTQRPAPAPTTDAWQTADRLAQETYAAAVQLSVTVPALEQTEALAARAATSLALLYANSRPGLAAEWERKAWAAWLRQRHRTPLDVRDTSRPRALYAAAGRAHGALRDACASSTRCPWTSPTATYAAIGSRPSRKWQPNPGSTRNSSASSTPRRRLHPRPTSTRSLRPWHRRHSAWPPPGSHCAGIIPWRPNAQRVPRSTTNRCTPDSPSRSRSPWPKRRTTSCAARRKTPRRPPSCCNRRSKPCPAFKRRNTKLLATPYRRQLSFALLVAGQLDEGLRMLGLALGPSADDPHELETQLKKLLLDAQGAGLPREQVQSVARELCPRFPLFCEQ